LSVILESIMHHEVLRDKLKAQPFQPFRIVMTTGKVYDVTSPEWVLVTRLTTAIGLPGESGDGDILRHLDNLHIVELLPIDSKAVAMSA
jgi:hypothetical protein